MPILTGIQHFPGLESLTSHGQNSTRGPDSNQPEPSLLSYVDKNDALSSAISRGFGNAIDRMAAYALAETPTLGVTRVAGFGIGALQAVYGLSEICDGGFAMAADKAGYHKTPKAGEMKILTGIGDIATGIGLFGQTLVNGSAFLPLTLLGAGIATIGTIGRLLGEASQRREYDLPVPR